MTSSICGTGCPALKVETLRAERVYLMLVQTRPEQQLLKQGRNTEVLLPRTVVHQQIKSRCFGNTYLFGQIPGHEQITKSSMQCPVTKPDYFQFNAGLFRQCNGGKRGTDAVCQTSGRDKYHFSFHIAQK